MKRFVVEPTPFWTAALVLSATLIIYATHLHGEYVWDDVYHVRDNALLWNPRGLGSLLTTELWTSSGREAGQLYHPLPTASLWLQAQAGAGIEGFRWGNILLHLACIFLTLDSLRCAGFARWPIVLVAMVLAVHPTCVEPVQWITGRHDTVGVLLLLAGLRLSLGSPGKSSVQFASGLVAGLALASKEAFVLAPFWVPLAAGLRTWGIARDDGPQNASSRSPIREALPSFFGVVTTLALTMGLRHFLGISPKTGLSHTPLMTHAANAATVVGETLGRCFGLQSGTTTMEYKPWSLPQALALVGLLLATGLFLLRATWHRRPWAWAMMLGFGTILFACAPLTIAVPAFGMYGNRYAYFPLMASAWVLAPLFQIVPAWLSPFSRRALGVAMFVVLLTTGAVSYQRAALWRDGETLFGADVAQEPDNPFALYHLGVSIERRAGCANAVPLFQRAASLQPNTWRPWHNTAGCLLRLGRWDEASVAAATAVKLRPQHPGSLLNFGLVELHEGHLEEAKGALRACEGANGAEKRCLELASAIQAAQKLPLSAPR